MRSFRCLLVALCFCAAPASAAVSVVQGAATSTTWTAPSWNALSSGAVAISQAYVQPQQAGNTNIVVVSWAEPLTSLWDGTEFPPMTLAVFDDAGNTYEPVTGIMPTTVNTDANAIWKHAVFRVSSVVSTATPPVVSVAFYSTWFWYGQPVAFVGNPALAVLECAN